MALEILEASQLDYKNDTTEIRLALLMAMLSAQAALWRFYFQCKVMQIIFATAPLRIFSGNCILNCGIKVTSVMRYGNCRKVLHCMNHEKHLRKLPLSFPKRSGRISEVGKDQILNFGLFNFC